jgi:hypothetical protein
MTAAIILTPVSSAFFVFLPYDKFANERLQRWWLRRDFVGCCQHRKRLRQLSFGVGKECHERLTGGDFVAEVGVDLNACGCR